MPLGKDKVQRTARFTQALENMKILAEGGTLPRARRARARRSKRFKPYHSVRSYDAFDDLGGRFRYPLNPGSKINR